MEHDNDERKKQKRTTIYIDHNKNKHIFLPFFKKERKKEKNDGNDSDMNSLVNVCCGKNTHSCFVKAYICFLGRFCHYRQKCVKERERETTDTTNIQIISPGGSREKTKHKDRKVLESFSCKINLLEN